MRDTAMPFDAEVDFEDENAYFAFHVDDEHSRFRREVLAHIVENSALCHYRV